MRFTIFKRIAAGALLLAMCGLIFGQGGAIDLSYIYGGGWKVADA